DLEAQMVRLQSGISNRLFDDAGKALLADLTNGHVDGDAVETTVRESPLPLRERLARLAQHPGAERVHEAELLGHRNERRRSDGLSVARPAHQRFEAGARARTQ